MNSKIMLSLATVALFAATASATNPTSSIVTTNAWFTEETTSLTGINGTWSGATTAASDEGDNISLDTDVDEPLYFTPSTWTGAAITEYSFVTKLGNLVVHASDPSVYGTPYGALIAVTNNDGYASVWKRVSGSGWVAVSAVGAPAPEEGHTYFAKIEVDAEAAKVRYSVGTSAESLIALTGWVDAGKSVTASPKLAYAGCATIAKIDAVVECTVTVTVPVDTMTAGVKEALASLAEITVDENFETTLATALSDDSTKLDNGLTLLQSVILGVNDNTAASKPYVAPVQNGDYDTLSFKLGNVDVTKYLGANAKNVTFTILESTDNSKWSETEEDTGKNVTSTGAARVSVPTTGVKYYKIKITIK